MTLISTAFGYHTAMPKEVDLRPVRWDSSSVMVIDSASPLAGPALDALRQWDAPMPVRLGTGEDANIKVELLDPDNPRAGGEATPEVKDREIIACSIKVSTTLQDDLVMPTLIHEMGHCLGLKHDMTNEPSIMYYDMAGWETGLFSFEMTDHDLAILARTYAL